MRIKIKARDVEIEYEEPSTCEGYYFMLGKKAELSEKYIDRLKQLIDGVDQLLDKLEEKL